MVGPTPGVLKYLNSAIVKLETRSSTLVSSSPYLNSAPLRAIIAQEMLRRNGADLPNTAYVGDVMGLISQHDDMGALVALFDSEVERLPDLKARVERRGHSNFTGQEVAGYAPGTLGAALHDFIVESGMTLGFSMPETEATSNFAFYMQEKQISHDIIHMITGFPLNHAGEFAILAAETRANCSYFKPELAAWLNRPWLYLKAKTTMQSLLFYPRASAAELEAEDFGARQGRQWKFPLTLITWRDHLDWQITDMRKAYGIEDVPEDGIWDWTTDAAQDPREDLTAELQIAAE